MRWIIHIQKAIAVALTALVVGVADDVEATQGERIVLEHADTLRSIGGRRELIGSVRIRRGETVIRAVKAVHYLEQGLVTLSGAVDLIEPGRRIKADQMTYDERSGDFEALGNVETWQGDSVRTRCNLAHYNKADGRVDLYEQVVIDNIADGAQITGRHGWWLEEEETATVEGDPIYRLPDKEANPPDTLQIEGRRLAYERRTGTAQFIGKVRFYEGELRGEADTLAHTPDSSITVLTGNPKLWRDDDNLSGVKIEIFYNGRQAEKLVVSGDAVALSPAREGDERRNRMSGEKISIITETDTTRRVDVVGTAKGLYYVWDEKDVYQGVNLAAADEIELGIVRGKVTGIALAGKTNGAFYPPGMEEEVIRPSLGGLQGDKVTK
jgi:lipopolysaccharide export system protein LptA